MKSIEQLTEELLALKSASRALLAQKLVESLEFDTEPTIQAAWMTEAKKRRSEIRSGSVQPIPGVVNITMDSRTNSLKPRFLIV